VFLPRNAQVFSVRGQRAWWGCMFGERHRPVLIAVAQAQSGSQGPLVATPCRCSTLDRAAGAGEPRCGC